MTKLQADKGFSLYNQIDAMSLTSDPWTSRKAADNSRFAKAGVSCFHDSEVLNSSFVLLMKFCAEKPRLRKAAKRYAAA
jgi:hypothetical protein